MSVKSYTEKSIISVTRAALTKALLGIKAVDTDRSSTVPLEVFNGPVCEPYRAVLDSIIAQRDASPDLPHSGTVHVSLIHDDSLVALMAILNANGRNRLRDWHHVSDLAHTMQNGGYRPCLTDCAVTVGEKTANAGHSIAAIFAAFVPMDFFSWARVEGVSELVEESADSLEPEYQTVFPIPPVRKDASSPAEGFISAERVTGNAAIKLDDGKEVPEFTTWNDEERAADYLGYFRRAFEGIEHFAELRVCLQVEAHAVTAYDTVARGRQATEQLYLFAPTRHFESCRDWLDLKVLSQVLKALHLRCKPENPAEIEKGSGVWNYGTNKGGGRTNPAHFPAFCLAHLKRLANCDYIRQNYGSHGSLIDGSYTFPALFEVFEDCPELTGLRSNMVKDFATVFCTLSPAECVELVARLQDPDDKLVKALNKRLTDDNSGNWVRPSADWIQSVLILMARGADKIPSGKALPSYTPAGGDTAKRAELFQLTPARGAGWDCGQGVTESRHDVEYLTGAVHPAAVLVDTYFGESGKEGRAEAFRPKRKNRKRSDK